MSERLAHSRGIHGVVATARLGLRESHASDPGVHGRDAPVRIVFVMSVFGGECGVGAVGWPALVSGFARIVLVVVGGIGHRIGVVGGRSRHCVVTDAQIPHSPVHILDIHLGHHVAGHQSQSAIELPLVESVRVLVPVYLQRRRH